MNTPVLLLDVMDTIVYDPAYKEMLAWFGVDRATLLAKRNKEAYHAFERGELDRDAFAEAYLPGERLDVAGLEATLARHYRFVEGMEALLRELAEIGCSMHALSNYPQWWTLIEDRLELSRFLEWSFVSCRMGVRKPNPAMYRGAAAALGVAPEACLFIDDREKNCAGARAIGMSAHRFESAAGLRTHLRELGFDLTPPE